MVINPNANVTIDDVDGLLCLTIDDFFLEPDRVRQYAIDSMQQECTVKTILGYEIHPNNLTARYPDYENHVAQIIHQYLGMNISEYFGFDASVVTLRGFKGPYFNCLGINQLPDFPPHVDNGHISSFIYLSTPEKCTGGTRIYRHIPTNAMNLVQKEGTEIKWMMQKPLHKPLVESTEEWEMVKFFEMKYNRLVAFNSSAIHKIDISGGQFTMDIDDARLCLNCFYRYINPDGSVAGFSK